MKKALFIDYMGSLATEDNQYIQEVIRRAYIGSRAQSPQELAAAWFQIQEEMLRESYGASYRLEHDIALEAFRRLKEKFGVREKAQTLLELLERHWWQSPMYGDVKEFMEKCPLPIYIVTNNDNKYLEEGMKANGLLSYPAGVITSEMARAYKPRPEIFRMALERSGCEPQDVIHIGDSLTVDVAGAKAVGIEPWLLNRKSQAVEAGLRSFSSLYKVLDALPRI